MSDSESGDEQGGYESYDMPTGEQQGGSKGEIPTVNADLRMDKLPEPPRSLQTSGPAQNTGPKGVKKDFEIAKRNLQGIKMREQIEREMAIETKAKGKMNLSVQESSDKKDGADKKDKSSSKHPEDEDDDSEDEEFQKYKMKMMQQIQNVQNSLPTFGDYRRVNFEEWVGTIKNVHELTYVVSHLYENHIPACARLNVCFEELAPQFDHVLFVRIKSTEAIKDYNEIGLPTLIVYRGGKMVHNFVRVTDQFSKEFKPKEVAQFLAGLKLLKLPTGFDSSSDKKASKTSKKDNDN
jgi:predicted RNA-binding protein with RPS1 domain